MERSFLKSFLFSLLLIAAICIAAVSSLPTIQAMRAAEDVHTSRKLLQCNYGALCRNDNECLCGYCRLDLIFGICIPP